MRVSVLLAAVLVAAACTVTGGQAGAPKTVELTLVAGKADASGSIFSFNGYSNGKMTLTVPLGWTVVVTYQNRSPLRHSFDVIGYTGPQPQTPPPPVFKGAATKDPVDGIGVGRQETITFVAERAGKYEFLCGALGHAQAGMWDYLIVSSAATAPTVTPNGAAALKVR